jgi:alcohol dehydrogenase class IV
MDLLAPADWSFPVPIAYGPGRLGDLPSICVSAGMTNPLVVTDRGSATLPFIGRSIDALRGAGLQVDVFSGISPNPVGADISAGTEVFRHGGHDGVVAIGGGSGMDGGKAISLVANNGAPLWAFDYDAETSPDLAPAHLVPLVCVPTTAGTGAETESTAMVTDTERGVKVCVWHPLQRPAAAILDPMLTLGLPANLTAWTGIDALVHAIEAYSVPDFHPMCDALALQAIRAIWAALPTAVDDGTNLEARAAMLTGSCLAGISFLKGLGLVHAMSHMIGAVYDTHHGLTNAVMLAPVIEFNKEVLGPKTAVMAQAMGLDDTSHESFAGAIDSMLARLEIPKRLRDIGVGDDRLNEVAHKSRADAAARTNPRSATIEEIEGILTARL